MRPHSGPFLSFLAYYMGAPSEQFLRINYGAPSDQFIHLIWRPRSLCIFSYYMGVSRIISLHTILGLHDHFLRLLYGAPQVSFFSYNMGAPLRSLSLITICPPPQISFFACYRGATSDYIFFTKYMGPPRSVSPLTIWGPLRLVSLLTIWGPLRSVSVHTFWGLSQISFFSYYMGPLRSVFFRILYGGPTNTYSFLAYYMWVT